MSNQIMNEKTPNKHGLPLKFTTMQHLLIYLENHLTVLQTNIKHGSDKVHENMMGRINSNEEVNELLLEKMDQYKFINNLTKMRGNMELIENLIGELKILTSKKTLPNLPLLLKLSTYLNNTIQHQSNQYDHNIREMETLTTYYQEIEHTIRRHLPPLLHFNLPYILIETDYDKNTSIYVKIYDYILHSLQVVEIQMKMYNECILSYEKKHPNATEEELMRWKLPYSDLWKERENITNIITYFQYVFKKNPQPTGKEMIRDPEDPAELFFETLDKFLSNKLHQLIEQEMKREPMFYGKYRDDNIRELQIEKIRLFVEEVGPAYQQILRNKNNGKKKFKSDM